MMRDFLVMVAVVAVLLVVRGAATGKAEDKRPAGLTAEQARREVQLLDDLYKTAVVYINDVYVTDANSVAAGETARDLFAAMKAKGWHDARLVDATGRRSTTKTNRKTISRRPPSNGF